MKRLTGIFDILIVAALLPAAALAQVAGGPISGGGGSSGGGVTGLTSCADGTAIADNALLRGDGTTKCQGSAVTVADTTGAISGAQSITGGTSGSSTLTLDGDSGVTGAATVSGDGGISSPSGVTIVGSGGFFVVGSSPSDYTGAYFGKTGGFGYLYLMGAIIEGNGTSVSVNRPLLSRSLVEANTAGSGAPNVFVALESGTLSTNEGSAAQNYHTLPPAAAGLCFEFAVQDADGLRVVADTGDTIRIAGSVSAGAGYVQNSTIGSTIRLCAINATEWFAMGTPAGTWTIDS